MKSETLNHEHEDVKTSEVEENLPVSSDNNVDSIDAESVDADSTAAESVDADSTAADSVDGVSTGADSVDGVSTGADSVDGVSINVDPDEAGDDNADLIDEDLQDSATSREQGEDADISLEKQLIQATDQIKRQAAEFQNYRRRTEIEKRQMVSIGKSLVLERLLDVFDDLQRSVIAAQDAEPEAETAQTHDAQKSFESLRSGLELAHQKLMDELKKLDVVVIESIGQVFDEEIHEAVMQQPATEGKETGIVLAEIQRGFKLGDRVLRHAKVVVSS